MYNVEARHVHVRVDVCVGQSPCNSLPHRADLHTTCLPQTTAELEAQLQLSGQHRQQLASAQQAEREAQAAFERLEATNAQQAQQASRAKHSIA